MTGNNASLSTDPYREPISEADSAGVGIAPAKKVTSHMHTPLDEVRGEWTAREEGEEEVLEQETQTSGISQSFVETPISHDTIENKVQLEPASTSTVKPENSSQEETEPPQFVIEEIKPVEVPLENLPTTQSSQFDPDAVDLEVLKQREKELELHLAEQKKLQEELHPEPIELPDFRVMSPSVFAESLKEELDELQKTMSAVEQDTPQKEEQLVDNNVANRGSSTGVYTPEKAVLQFEVAYQEKHIEQARTFDELYAKLDDMDLFHDGPGGEYALRILKKQIEMVRAGSASINTIDTVGGLRMKVLELTTAETQPDVKEAA